MNALHDCSGAEPGVFAVHHELLRELIQTSGQVRVRANGTSMVPTIWPGEELVIQRLSGQIFAGDIVAFLRDQRLFIHRTIAVDGATVTTQGDRLAAADAPVSHEQILGTVAKVVRRGNGVVLSREPSLAARLLRWVSRASEIPLLLLLRCRDSAILRPMWHSE